MQKPLLCILAFAVGIAVAGAKELTAADIARIKEICRALAGADAAPAKSDRIFHRLSPYLAHKRVLADLHVICDQRCSGWLKLRDTADIYFAYPDSSDPHTRIDTVVFHHRGKTILSIGSDANR
jgi:hypothetical protein